jgi:hypothetical protein
MPAVVADVADHEIAYVFDGLGCLAVPSPVTAMFSWPKA